MYRLIDPNITQMPPEHTLITSYLLFLFARGVYIVSSPRIKHNPY